MTANLNNSGSIRRVSGQTTDPLVGYITPFVGHDRPLFIPFIGLKLPLVTKWRKQRGFTLVELMITLVILGVLSAIAAPAMRDMVMNNRIVTETNDMLVALTLARSEAIKRSSEVFLCMSADPQASPPLCGGAAWTTGWLIYTDTSGNNVYDVGTSDVLIRIGDGFPGTSNKIKLSSGDALFSFTRLGLLSTASMFIYICDNRGVSHARVIDVFSTGRSRINRSETPDCT